ncbi:MAG: BrnT family toxin [Stenotrophobium sp.]
MKIEFDPVKNERNIMLRGLPFQLAAGFDFETAQFCVDTRKDYGETRIQARGFVADRLHVLVFVESPRGIRVISLRKANKREVKRYEKETQSRTD